MASPSYTRHDPVVTASGPPNAERPSQIACGRRLLCDGNGHWYDVSKVPANLDNFPRIDDLNAQADGQAEERAMIEAVLKGLARWYVGGQHSFHEDPERKLVRERVGEDAG